VRRSASDNALVPLHFPPAQCSITQNICATPQDEIGIAANIKQPGIEPTIRKRAILHSSEILQIERIGIASHIGFVKQNRRRSPKVRQTMPPLFAGNF
jgi:hypothetical protein